MIFLEKVKHNDFMRQVESSVSGYVSDYDETYIYVSRWSYEVVGGQEVGMNKMYQYSYSVDGDVVTVDVESEEEIVRKTEYSVISKLLDKYFGSSKKETPILKQFDDKMDRVIVIRMKKLFIS